MAYHLVSYLSALFNYVILAITIYIVNLSIWLWTEKDEKQNALEVLIRRVEGLQYGKFCILLVSADVDQPSLIILH